MSDAIALSLFMKYLDYKPNAQTTRLRPKL